MAKFPEIYKTTAWEQVREFVIVRDNGLCQECFRHKKLVAGKDVDHIIELTQQNKSDWDIAYNSDNLQLLCSACHNRKHNRCTGLPEFVNPL